jgi:hypothetical protein
VLVEIVAALVWLAVGTLGIGAAGFGTLLLAFGIGASGWILVENRRQGPRPFDPARSAELLRLVGGTVAVVIVASILFGLIGWSAFLPGLAAAVTGGAFLLLSRATGQRATGWLGAALLGLGVLSAFVSTQAATGFFAQGVVGLLAGVLLLVSAADRVGLLEMLRDRNR